MARHYFDEAYNPDAYEPLRHFLEKIPPAPIDVDAFNEEQDHIERIKAIVEAEYTRINGPSIFATAAPWNDRHCTLCNGRGLVGGEAHCTQCGGTGAESVIFQERGQ